MGFRICGWPSCCPAGKGATKQQLLGPQLSLTPVLAPAYHAVFGLLWYAKSNEAATASEKAGRRCQLPQQSAMCVNSACVVPMKARVEPALWNGDLVHVEVDGVQLIVDAASCQVGFVSCQHETTAPLLRCLQADLDAVQVHLPFWLPLVPVFLHLCPLPCDAPPATWPSVSRRQSPSLSLELMHKSLISVEMRKPAISSFDTLSCFRRYMVLKGLKANVRLQF